MSPSKQRGQPRSPCLSSDIHAPKLPFSGGRGCRVRPTGLFLSQWEQPSGRDMSPNSGCPLEVSPRGSGRIQRAVGEALGKSRLFIGSRAGRGLMVGNRDGEVGAEGMGSSARDHPSPPGTPRDSPALCFVLCFKFGSCCSSSGDGNIHQKKNPWPQTSRLLIISLSVKDPHKYPCPAPPPRSEKGRGAGEGEHLTEINILHFLIKYENPAGAGSRTILEHELSRPLHPRCPFFPPQPFQASQMENKSFVPRE